MLLLSQQLVYLSLSILLAEHSYYQSPKYLYSWGASDIGVASHNSVETRSAESSQLTQIGIYWTKSLVHLHTFSLFSLLQIFRFCSLGKTNLFD